MRGDAGWRGSPHIFVPTCMKDGKDQSSLNMLPASKGLLSPSDHGKRSLSGKTERVVIWFFGGSVSIFHLPTVEIISTSLSYLPSITPVRIHLELFSDYHRFAKVLFASRNAWLGLLLRLIFLVILPAFLEQDMPKEQELFY